MREKKVLVPLDGSPESEAIFSVIEEIAGPLDMEVVLFHAVQLPPIDALALPHTGAADELGVRERDAHEYLEELAGRLTAKGIRTDVRVRVGDPTREILAVVAEERADLIAMTTHGRSGFGRLLFGSVAEALLRSAPVPIFLMRMTKEALKLSTPAAQVRDGGSGEAGKRGPS